MKKIIILLILLISFTALSQNIYVDKNASGNNSGSNWTNACSTFASIPWGSLGGGDTLFVSGSTDSTIYYETMTVGANGTSDNQITIIAGKYAPNPIGHDGRVIIDGESSRTYGIHLDNTNYVTVKGVECRNIQLGIAIRHDCVGCIVDSCRITNFTEQGAVRIDGSGATCNPTDWVSSDHIIQNNTIISPVDVPTQCDGIYIQRCQDVLVHNNFIHNRNASLVNSHTDGIQTHCTMNLTFTNNVVIVDSNASGMPMVIRQESDGIGDADSVIFYNNLFYSGGGWYSGFPWINCIDHQSDWGPSGVEPYTIMIHNTLISHGPSVAPVWKERHGEPDKHTMINNMVVQYGDGVADPNQYQGMFRNSGGAWVVDSTRGGFYYCEWGDFDCAQQVTGNGNTGSCHSWDSWVNTYGGTGTYGNPLFVSPIGYIEDEGDITGELQSGSPAINAGDDVQAIIEGMGLEWKDINGLDRDSTPDVGAYQYEAAGVDTIPSFSFTPVTGVELNSYNIGTAIFSGADSTFNVWSVADSFKIGALGTYDVVMDTASSGDTLFTPITASGSYSTEATNTILAGGNSQVYSVTTKADPAAVITKTKLLMKK